MERKRRNVKDSAVQRRACRSQEEGDNPVYHLYLSTGEMMKGKRERQATKSGQEKLKSKRVLNYELP